MNRLKTILLFCLLFTLSGIAIGQNNDSQLALEYYRNGELDKALVIYEKLYDANPSSSYHFGNYFKTLMALDYFDDAEKAVKKQIKKYPSTLSYRVNYGYVYYKKGEEEKAREEYDKALKALGPDKSQTTLLGSAFSAVAEQEYAIEAYLRGSKLLKDENLFNIQLANLYQRTGKIPEMMGSYLNHVAVYPNQIQTVKNVMIKHLKEESYVKEFQSQLYKRIQKDDAMIVYPELLTWLNIQQKDYEGAFVQVKALDRKLNEGGNRVYSLGMTAFNEKEYTAAIDAFQYVISLGKESPLYLKSYQGLLKAQKSKITSNVGYSNEDISSLQKDYYTFLEEFGKHPGTASTIRELSNIEAFYVHDVNQASELMNDLIVMPGLNEQLKAECKLDLGDFYLIQGEVWESTLLYSQVDLAFKEGPLGEEARFRNAKLAYYRGDFEFAQSQLTILKASTSELIANDALDLSIFIMDNLGLDTTTVPMEMFSRSDLLIFQNKNKDAMLTLDSISNQFAGHSLSDDILFAKSRININNKEFDKAISLLEELLATPALQEELLADNALFTLASLYEEQKDDKATAKDLYEEIVLNHSGSIFITEARKRYRALRGSEL